jgi:hypothetical protein
MRAGNHMSALKDSTVIASERATADLRFCGEQFESIRNDLVDLTSGLDIEQLGWQPNASTWSIAQCIEHLSCATAVDVRRLSAMIAIALAARDSTRGPWRSASSAPVVLLHESGRQSTPIASGARLLPPEVEPGRVVERFLELNQRLLDVIDRATRSAPIAIGERSGAVLFDPVGHALQLNALHHWRFLLQARRVTEFPSFPRH